MIDARGLSCPMPVIMVQKAINSGASSTFTVMVDNECSAENITRYAESCGYTVSSHQDGSDCQLLLTK